METKRKHSKELRIRTCEQYISGQAGALDLARANGLGKRGDVLVYRWVRRHSMRAAGGSIPWSSSRGWSAST